MRLSLVLIASAFAMQAAAQPAMPSRKPGLWKQTIASSHAGKAPGMLSANPQRAKEYLAQGASFVAVGSDTTLLVRAAKELLQSFKPGAAKAAPAPTGAY